LVVAAVIVVANQCKTASRSLIAISDVERVFNDEVVKELARTEKLPLAADCDIARLAENIRIDARIFLEEKAKLGAPQLRAAIKRLYQLNRRAEDGSDQAAQKLARAADAMPPDLRRWLISCYGPHECCIPTAAEILSPATRKRAVERFRLILSFGGSVNYGRKRPSGGRSLSFKPQLRVPEIGRGHPSGSAERRFLECLALTYLEATSKLPPYAAHYNTAIRGPFSRLVQRCFELAGASTGSVIDLINEYGRLRRGKMPRQRNRRRRAQAPVS
jgi:hypothetical protein